MEDDLDAAESRLSGLYDKLTEAEKSTDENDQAKKQLENRGSNDASRLVRLEAELEELKANNEEVASRYEVTSLEGTYFLISLT